MRSDQLFKVEGYGVIVTGGASGLGLGYTEALAENGARVTMLDVDAERIAHESQRLHALGYAVRGEVVDVRDHAGLDRAFDADDNLSEDTKRFIDRHVTPGEKRPPAPSVRRDPEVGHALPRKTSA